MSNREIWVIHNLTSQAVEIDGAGVISGGSSKAVEGIVSRERIAQSAYVLSLLQTDSVRIDLQVDGATTETVTSANASTALLPARLADLDEGGSVTSVAGKTGVVTLDTDDIDGLDTALDGKADSVHTHPISDVTNLQATLDAKAGASTVTAHIANTSNPHSVTKSQIGLGNVDNTSDANKPVSTAAQTALDGKLSLTGGTLTGPLSISTFKTEQVTGTTTNGTATTIHSVSLNNSQTVVLEAFVVGVKPDGTSSVGGTMSAAYRRNSSGTISQVGVTNTILNTDDDAYDFDFIEDNTAHTVKVNVTGKASTTINWTATIKTQKSA